MRLARATANNHSQYGEVVDGLFFPLAGDVFADRVRSGDGMPLSQVRLESPTQPRTLLLILGGFLPADGTPLPAGSTPLLTPMITSRVGGDGDDIVIPEFVTAPLWMEVELAVVIGTKLHNASQDEAREGILGFTCFNDISAPEFIFDRAAGKLLTTPDFFRSKSIDAFAIMGPWVETAITERDIEAGLVLRTHVNGEVKATGDTRALKFPPSRVVSYVTQQITLYPGDVIALGTPQPCEAGPGDVVEVEVEGVGSIRNRIVTVDS